MTDTFRSLCAEVLAYYEGLGVYDFSLLNPYDRENAAFDAWMRITAELKHALAQPEPALQPIALTEREPEYDSFCWFGHWTGNCWIWQWGTGPHHWQTHWLPANALPTPEVQ